MSEEKFICPMCESGELVAKKTKETYCYEGHEFSLEDIEYSECPACRSKITTPPQLKRNEARIRDEHRKIDGLLTGAEITRLRNRLNITQEQAIQIFGADDHFAKYENGEMTQNVAMDKLMRLSSSVPTGFEKLLEISDLHLKMV